LAELLSLHWLVGSWSTDGPLLVGWLVVAINALRLAAHGLSRWRFAGGASAADGGTSQAMYGPGERQLWQPSSSPASEILDWQVLGLAPGASLQNLSAAYRVQAQIWHPDKYIDAPDIQSRAAQRMKRINAAYARLSAAGDPYQ
jgi:DnaJ-domain-containing protein 1